VAFARSAPGGHHAIAAAGSGWRARGFLQVDGSRHRWFGPDLPFATLVAGIDDATSRVAGGTFRAAEDATGYFTTFAQTAERHGLPGATYSDRHGIFGGERNRPPTLAEQLTGKRSFTQVGRALEEAGSGWIGAHSAEAKGRVERLWGTLQDRLVAELRPEGIARMLPVRSAIHAFATFTIAKTARNPALAAAERAWRSRNAAHPSARSMIARSPAGWRPHTSRPPSSGASSCSARITGSFDAPKQSALIAEAVARIAPTARSTPPAPPMTASAAVVRTFAFDASISGSGRDRSRHDDDEDYRIMAVTTLP
jgi:hypothetical protein